MAVVPSFRKAQRRQCKASILVEGLSGRGKTGLVLAIAHGLTKDWSKIAAVDTENKSMDLYAGVKLHTGATVGEFMVGDLTADDGYKPSHYLAYRDAAIALGMEALLCDSISHMWQYKGSVLDMVTQAQRNDPRLNKYTAWGIPEVVNEKNIIMSLIRHPKLHCINAVRVKEKMEFITGDDGKTVLKSLGEQEIMMPDLKYEPDLVLSMLQPGSSSGKAPRVFVVKSRYAPFVVDETYDLTANMIEQLRLFLEEGTSPEELEQMQRDDYVKATSEFLDANPNLRSVWDILKDRAGVKGVALKDLSLAQLKLLFGQLVS